MKKLIYLIVLTLILSLVLTGCLLSNVGQVPTSPQSGITYLTKGILVPGNLVGLWHFDEGEGYTAYDSSGTILPNDGTVYGEGWVDGKFGKALSFDGIDDHVDCGDISTANWVNLTTEAWVYWDGTVRQGYAGVYSKAYGSDIGRLLINGAGGILVQNGNGNFWSENISGDVPVNEWCHIAYVYDQVAGKEYIYVNGDKKGEKVRTTGDITQNSNNFCIGYGWMGPDNYIFSGLIDEVRIWDIALDSTEITHSYELGVNDEMEYVTQLNQQDLLEGGVAIFTSAFYVGKVTVGDHVEVLARVMIVGSELEVTDDAFRGKTPKGALIGYTITNLTITGFDIEAWRENEKAKSLHLSMLLDTDEGLGVNVQFLPYD